MGVSHSQDFGVEGRRRATVHGELRLVTDLPPIYRRARPEERRSAHQVDLERHTLSQNVE